jgi:hypothetical protein
MIIIDVCLSDIPAEARKKSEKNGKVYCKLVVDERKEKDNYGNTHVLYVNQTKEDRANGVKKDYVGNGVEYVFGNNAPKTNKKEESDGLPF